MHGTTKTYTIGFILSLLLTFEAYYLVVNHSLSRDAVIYTVLALAIVQLLVQLFYFLHFDQATRRSWNIIVFLFMTIVVSILVFGSLWVMQHLNYHTGTPEETSKYLKDNEGL